ncbi:hypothetical protein K1T71_006462 [Dendrolimus kikuchii]|uniref:Uncharacterized protein n=1 Tax=Dendrolimus kikuchii TaxID=765133 RepID=A0ACC1D0W7_9NEOP|nr:hypothetical protein K1T71_006462 [Dendrolimus kikuchii]
MLITLSGWVPRELICLTYQAEWSYKYETQWPGVCRAGELQSPINIMTRSAVVDYHEAHIRGPLGFRGYGDVKVAASNNGHTLKWSNIPDTPAPIVSGGPLRGNYTFLQFHLHWLSEHAIDGMKYPLEIHMVHIKTGLSVEEALKRPDGLAVMGVMGMVHSGGNSEYALDQIMPVIPDLMDRTEKDIEEKTIDMTRLFSPDPQSYYTYHGSLTTPNCQEVVTWIVMDKPLMISDSQYKMLLEVNVGARNNYRSLQATNRVVYRSVASCSAIIMPSLASTLISLMVCLSSTISAGVKKGICIITSFKKKFLRYDLPDCSKFQ